MAFSELLEQTGGLGLFQCLLMVNFCFLCILLPSQILMDVFLVATPGHRCWVRLLDNGSEVPAHLTPEALLAISIPVGPNREPDQCLRFRQPQWQLLEPNATAANGSQAATESCVDGWVYDRSVFASTVVAEWGLVCARQSLQPVAQAVFMAGILLGFIVCGLLSYWFGQKPLLIWCCLPVALANSSAIFAPNFLIYCGLRFLTALGVSGIMLAVSTFMLEWIPAQWMDVIATILGCHYSLGQIILGGLAFALRDWRTLILTTSVPFLVIFLICWWIPESAQWLIVKGKPDQALQELRKIARMNGHKEVKKTLTIEVLLSSMKEELASAKTRPSILDLFRVPILRWRTIYLAVASFCILFSYYGLMLDLQSLGGDIFLLQVLFGVVDFLSRSTCSFLLRFFGRRSAVACFLAMAGLCILANVLVPQDLQTLRVVFAVLGKGCFGVSITILTVHKSGLFPTPLRMVAEGFLQSTGRLGTVMSPLIRMSHQAMPLLPHIIYGALPVIASLITLLLPETQGFPLPDTIQDLENQRLAVARRNRREVVIIESTWF